MGGHPPRRPLRFRMASRWGRQIRITRRRLGARTKQYRRHHCRSSNDQVYAVLHGYLDKAVGESFCFPRLGAILLLINISVAIATTKIPILLRGGFFAMEDPARTDYSMFMSLLFLLIVGAGPISLDARVLKRLNKPPA